MTEKNRSTDDSATTSSPSASSQSKFVITRVFDAPRDLVFQAWTEPDRLARWWMRKGFSMLSSTIELRTGGVFHHGMRSPDGFDIWGKWIFREVVVPERLVFVVSFSDEEGGVTRHPLSADWPLEVLSTLTFTEQEGKSTFTLRGSPLNASDAELKAFETAHESMQKGWTETLDQLADYLAQS